MGLKMSSVLRRLNEAENEQCFRRLNEAEINRLQHTRRRRQIDSHHDEQKADLDARTATLTGVPLIQTTPRNCSSLILKIAETDVLAKHSREFNTKILTLRLL